MKSIQLILFHILYYLLATTLADLPPLSLSTKSNKKSIKFPPCKSCSLLTVSFMKGVEKTARHKHDGGDAEWEEQKLGSYKKSEVRLVEIQESLCNDLNTGEDQCHSLAENIEHLIEEWWFKYQDEFVDFHKWLCIDNLKVCCPFNHYGLNCDKCPNCNGNGVCKGNGTRKGNGKCACDSGYAGEFCHDCDLEYYESFRDNEKLLCSSCHHSCAVGGCTSAGPKGCRICKRGWNMKPDLGGCIDIDECAIAKHTCTKNQFCVNTDGSYSCLECDKSCNSCNGDGPDLCTECADGYELQNGHCKDVSQEKRNRFVLYTRYLTYLGLCIATCVIFQSSTWIASIVGLAVAIYVTLSEYWLNANTQTSSSSAIDGKPIEYYVKG